MKATITSKGQITLPSELRQRLGLRRGDQVEFVQMDEEWVVRPVHPEDDPFAEFVGLAPLPEDAVTFWRRARGWQDDS